MPEYQDLATALSAHPAPCVFMAAEPYHLRDIAIRDAVETLCEDYYITRTMLGDHSFRRLATAYVRGLPSEMKSSTDIGRTFPAWLDSQSFPDRSSSVANVVRCERLRFEAHHGEEGPVLDLGMFEAIDFAERCRLRIGLHPSTRFAWLSTEVIEFWLTHTRQKFRNVTLDGQFRGVLFSRFDHRGEGEVINATQHRLLCGMRLGETLGIALEAADRLYPESDARFCLKELVRCRAFSPLALGPLASNQGPELLSQDLM
jgi:hypothetical protein